MGPGWAKGQFKPEHLVTGSEYVTLWFRGEKETV